MLGLHFTPSLQSSFCILHPACVLPLVCSLHFTLSLHFTPGPQSAVCSPQSAFYTDRFGNGTGAIFENSSKLRASLFVTSRWPRSSGQTNYQVHHPPWSNLKHAPSRELPLAARKTVFSHLKDVDLPRHASDTPSFLLIVSPTQHRGKTSAHAPG